MSALRLAAFTLVAAASTGCAGATNYIPAKVAPGEIVLRDDDGLEMWAGGQRIAEAHRYAGLSRFVRCSPDAHRQARAAESNGVGGLILTYAGATFAVGGLAGLGGLAYYNKDPQTMGAFFAAGIGAEVVGIVLAGVGRKLKLQATGHAVDAVNYYNDAVGSLGSSCASAW